MKKSWKRGLIAGGVLTVATGVFVFFGYNSGRMPTLPTPTGVVVPPGMRYVGGDEFDGPLDSKKWRVEANSYYMWRRAHPASEVLQADEVFVRDGVLAVSPGGTQRDRSVTITHLVNIPGNIAGVIEFRARLVPPALFEGTHGAGLAIGDEAGHHARLASYWADSPEKIPATDAGEFHRYRMEWRAGVFHRYKDDLELPSDDSMMVDDDFTAECTSSGLPDWIESILPDSVVEELNPPVAAFARRRHQFEALAYADSLRHRHHLEIEYIRIFQE